MIKKTLAILCVIVVTGVSLTDLSAPKASAAFNQNNLMGDGMFENSGTMMAGDIDVFLNRYSNSCLSTKNGFTTPEPTGYSSSTGFTYGNPVSAGQAIAVVAQVYGINPQVILATLEKESSVVTGNASYHCQYINTAMGYGCPDSGSCPSNPATQSGFSKQITNAAWLLKFSEQHSLGNYDWAVIRGSWDNTDDIGRCYSGFMTQGNFKRGSGSTCSQTVFYDGKATIDGAEVHMDTGATAAFYRYTPHFHGNQNLVSIFESWFGSTQAGSFTIAYTTHPDGTLVRNFSEPEVYQIIDSIRYHVPNIETFNSHGFSWSEVRIATIPDKQLTISNSKLTFRGGTLIKGDSAPHVYVLRCMPTFCVKDHISSIDVFSGLGFGFIDVLVLPQSQVDGITQDKTITSSDVHLQDQLVLDNSSGKVYLIDTNTKRWVPSLEVFAANHFKWPKVKTVKTGDLALTDGANVLFPEGALLRANGDNAVYAANLSGSTYEKRHITSANTFGGLNYRLGDVFVVDASFLPSTTGATIAE